MDWGVRARPKSSNEEEGDDPGMRYATLITGEPYFDIFPLDF